MVKEASFWDIAEDLLLALALDSDTCNGRSREEAAAVDFSLNKIYSDEKSKPLGSSTDARGGGAG